MHTTRLDDGPDPFDVTVLGDREAATTVLFAVGSGGDPARHHGLLSVLAESGCLVIAPHAEPVLTPMPTEGQLVRRSRRLRLALDAFVAPDAPVAGVGHSIGASVLLAMAGGHMWMRAGRQVAIVEDARLSRLLLLAPPTGFFWAPGSLDAVRAPVLAWGGTADTITPPEQLKVLERGLRDRAPVALRVTDGAGHFSFMDVLPPQREDPLPDRAAFLASLAGATRNFVHST